MKWSRPLTTTISSHVFLFKGSLFKVYKMSYLFSLGWWKRADRSQNEQPDASSAKIWKLRKQTATVIFILCCSFFRVWNSEWINTSQVFFKLLKKSDDIFREFNNRRNNPYFKHFSFCWFCKNAWSVENCILCIRYCVAWVFLCFASFITIQKPKKQKGNISIY